MSHAVLSPSGAYRWLACTPSARLEQQFPDSSGGAAREGTLAHSLGELLLRKWLKQITPAAYKKALAKIEKNEFYGASMQEYAEGYATFVMEAFSEAQSYTSDAMIFLEQRLNLTDYVPEGFGTGDCVIIADGTLRIIDLKYGKGVPVDAHENKQMMLYALGALREFDYVYDIQEVSMTIYQPRLDSVTTYTLSVKELTRWAEKELRPKAALAFEGKGDFVAGKHCQFCRAKAQCKTLAAHNLELAKYEFKEGNLLTDTETSDILTRADGFKKWIKAVEEYALNEAVNNDKRWPGFKLVEGRSNRKYTDENAVVEKLKAEGIEEESIYAPRTVLGITAMEKAIGKAAFKEYLSGLVIKPEGKPTLAPEDDKRPAYHSTDAAINDFTNN